jgi:hypothetical protein
MIAHYYNIHFYNFNNNFKTFKKECGAWTLLLLLISPTGFFIIKLANKYQHYFQFKMDWKYLYSKSRRYIGSVNARICVPVADANFGETNNMPRGFYNIDIV